MSKDDNAIDHQSNWNSLINWLTQEHSIDPNQIKVNLIINPKNHQRTLVANQDIKEGTPIISIPNQALLNLNTLPNSFKDPLKPYQLNSFQTISYYLSNHHPNRRFTKKYPFQDYIHTLPRSFDEIPLCLILESRLGDLRRIKLSDYDLFNSIRFDLSDHSCEVRDRKFSGLKWMTRSMKVKCDEVTRRFLIDWKSVSSIQDEEIMSLDEFLWGWLNVNTRCLWFDLGLKDHDDNITLAPVIDMVNHTLSSKVKPICTPNTFSLYSSHPLNQFTSPSTKRLIISSQTSRSPTLHPTLSHRKGDEILFSYGSHSNLTLWSEYGFVIRPKFSNGWNSVEITREVLGLFDELKDDGVQKLSVLKDSKYWKDYTIESNPIGPSYRTLTALRLLYCPSLKLSNWYEIINGEKDECSLNVEDQIKGTIEKICLKLIEEIDLSLVDRSDWWIGNEGEGLGGCVKELVVEEKWILEGCVKLMNESN